MRFLFPMPFRKIWHIAMAIVCCSELLKIWANDWEFILYDIHNYCILDCQIICPTRKVKKEIDEQHVEVRVWNLRSNRFGNLKLESIILTHLCNNTKCYSLALILEARAPCIVTFQIRVQVESLVATFG